MPSRLELVHQVGTNEPRRACNEAIHAFPRSIAGHPLIRVSSRAITESGAAGNPGPANVLIPGGFLSVRYGNLFASIFLPSFLALDLPVAFGNNATRCMPQKSSART